MAKPNLSRVLTLEPLASDKTPLIDVRSAAEFAAGHLPYSTNIPLTVLESCWHELPPKGTAINLMANSDQFADLTNIFERQDYRVEQLLIAGDSNQSDWNTGVTSQRLWRANPLLENYIDLIKQNLNFEQPLVFDVGAGSGRDSVFLSLHGFEAFAFDNNQHALKRLKKFSARTELEIKTLELDFQTELEHFEQQLISNQPHLIMQARYLHRPLLKHYRDHLVSGAMVAIHTFTQAAAKFGKPKNPAYLLQERELEDIFSDWKILLNHEHKLEDGRPLSMFLAQKP